MQDRSLEFVDPCSVAVGLGKEKTLGLAQVV